MDDVKSEPAINVPPVTLWLILTALAVHLARMMLTPYQDAALIHHYALIPVELTEAPHDPWVLTRLLTFQLLHAGWVHIGVNTLSLLAFGAAVERQVVGGWRMLLLYVSCGVAGGIAQSLVDLSSTAPVVGASAGISGLFGVVVRAMGSPEEGGRETYIMAIFWMAIMAFTGSIGMPGSNAPVAWVAHIGGFLAGIILLPLFRGRQRPVSRL